MLRLSMWSEIYSCNPGAAAMAKSPRDMWAIKCEAPMEHTCDDDDQTICSSGGDQIAKNHANRAAGAPNYATRHVCQGVDEAVVWTETDRIARLEGIQIDFKLQHFSLLIKYNNHLCFICDIQFRNAQNHLICTNHRNI